VNARRVEVSPGLRLEVAERGRGPAILFLHGYTDSWRSFAMILPRLPADVRGVAISQRGHGESDRPGDGYAMADLAADAVATLDALGIQEAVVVGHSMGSLVAQEVAIGWPERVSRVVLVGATTTFDELPARGELLPLGELVDPVPREIAWDFQASTVHRPVPEELLATAAAESLKLPARVWRAALDGQLAFSSRGRLEAIAAPTLIVWGARDGIMTAAEQRRLRDGIRDARLEVYEDTGHAPHWEQPQRFTDDLLAFVRPALRRSA
jgi:pimeloyl-ACP methyl ester carboxylesterase